MPYTDPDSNDFVQFAIIQGNAAPPAFFIDKVSGELTAKIELLDYEVQRVYELSVSVTDHLGLMAVSTVLVAIEDVNEPPVVHERHCQVSENASIRSPICAVSATDPDNSLLSSGRVIFYLLGGSRIGNAAVTIDPVTGLLSVANSTYFDYETTPEFVVDVCVQDNGNPPLSGCSSVTIHLLDENDAPSLISPHTCEMDELPYDLSDTQLGVYAGVVVCNLSVLDQDASALWSSHSWRMVNVDVNIPFNVTDRGQVVIKTPRGINFEEQSQWNMVVQATDLGGLSSPPQRSTS